MNHTSTPTYGCYGEPQPLTGIISEYSVCCEHPQHEGRNKRTPIFRMYFQRWEFTPEEFAKVLEEDDYNSIGIPIQKLHALDDAWDKPIEDFKAVLLEWGKVIVASKNAYKTKSKIAK